MQLSDASSLFRLCSFSFPFIVFTKEYYDGVLCSHMYVYSVRARLYVYLLDSACESQEPCLRNLLDVVHFRDSNRHSKFIAVSCPDKLLRMKWLRFFEPNLLLLVVGYIVKQTLS